MSATAAEFGIVGYTHAGGVDRPLLVWKGGTVVVPHTNWRGVFGRGTNSSGGTSTVAIEWPGFISNAFHAIMASPMPTTNWMGSLIGGQRDPGGRMYMRNRYYDPATGQFTQTDPIGLAGGMNTYGFAGGDPVTNWDPFGTCYFRVAPDYAFGRCGDDQRYFDTSPIGEHQERGPEGRRAEAAEPQSGRGDPLPVRYHYQDDRLMGCRVRSFVVHGYGPVYLRSTGQIVDFHQMTWTMTRFRLNRRFLFGKVGRPVTAVYFGNVNAPRRDVYFAPAAGNLDCATGEIWLTTEVEQR